MASSETPLQIEEQPDKSGVNGLSESWDEFLTEQIKGFFDKFQGIKIVLPSKNSADAVCVRVHPPYMYQSIAIVDDGEKFNKLPRRHRIRLEKAKEARDHASDDIKKLLNRHFYDSNGQERSIAKGRAELDDIKRLLQEAVDQGLVPGPTSRDLREWLRKYGIGVDCSGFVQQVLIRLLQASYATGKMVSDEDRNYGLGFLRCSWVYNDIISVPDSGADIFERVPTPGEARPGDILVQQNHMRLVAQTDVAKDNGLVLTLAESTSARDIPLGQIKKEVDIGPRLIQVKYPEAQRQISDQPPLRRRMSDDAFKADSNERNYTLGRFKALDRYLRRSASP